MTEVARCEKFKERGGGIPQGYPHSCCNCELVGEVECPRSGANIQSAKDAGQRLEYASQAIHWVLTDMRNKYVTQRKRALELLGELKAATEGAINALEARA